MRKKGKKITGAALLIFIAAALFFAYTAAVNSHTYTIESYEGNVKSISPLFGTVSVSSDCDTEVVFTDKETGQKYTIGYITPGITEKIRLKRGKWYDIKTGGSLIIRPVKLKTE